MMAPISFGSPVDPASPQIRDVKQDSANPKTCEQES